MKVVDGTLVYLDAIAEIKRLRETLRLALEELIRLGAEENNGILGKNPVCEQIRTVLEEESK